MTDDAGTHIASDEELLSRYVLGRLDPVEREKVDRHTAGCAACMDALRHEMRIAAGARRLGRGDLKAELTRRIASAPAPSRWPRIVSAAAGLCILAGLGAYYAWFAGGGSLPSPAGGTPPLAGRTELHEQVEKQAPALQRADNVRGEKAAGNERRSGSPRSVMDASGAARGAPAGEPGGEFWSDGILEPEERGGAGGAVASFETNALLLKKKAVKEEEDHSKDALARPQGEYLVRQQPASALPPGRERSGRDQQKVPTRVDQRGGTTTMTMYLDSLLDEKEIKKARVEAVSDDSLVVTLGGKKILYRFPSGQAAQGQRQK